MVGCVRCLGDAGKEGCPPPGSGNLSRGFPRLVTGRELCRSEPSGTVKSTVDRCR